MTEQTWKERFRKQYQYWDLTSEEDLSDLEAFIAAERATARAEGYTEGCKQSAPGRKMYQAGLAEGAAEERNKLVKIIEEQIGRIPTNGGIMDIFMGDDGFIGKWIDRDILLEALTTKEHHAE